VLGVVTDRDLAARALAEGLGPGTPVRDVMSNAPMCCSPDSEIEEVERIMAETRVRRVPVVDEDGLCVGMVAQADLARNEDAIGDSEIRRTIERISEPR
jgi:CBS domain-containing protein